MNHFRTRVWLVVAAAACAGCRDGAGPAAPRPGDAAAPPLEIDFRQSCGLPEGRQQVDDPETGVFHVHFDSPKRVGSPGSGLYRRSAFEVTKVAGPFVKPVVFRLTGVPESFGCVGDPLALDVGGDLRDHLRLDGEVYCAGQRPPRAGAGGSGPIPGRGKGDVVTVEFTEKGRALLKPGALVSFKVDTGW